MKNKIEDVGSITGRYSKGFMENCISRESLGIDRSALRLRIIICVHCTVFWDIWFRILFRNNNRTLLPSPGRLGLIMPKIWWLHRPYIFHIFKYLHEYQRWRPPFQYQINHHFQKTIHRPNSKHQLVASVSNDQKPGHQPAYHNNYY